MVLLKDEANILVAKPGELGFLQTAIFFAVQTDGPRCGRIQRSGDMQKRTFPRAAGSQYRQILASIKIDRNAIENSNWTAERLKYLDDVLGFKICHCFVT